jgi:hypothetical protein
MAAPPSGKAGLDVLEGRIVGRRITGNSLIKSRLWENRALARAGLPRAL